MKRYYQPRGGKKGKFALRENTYRRTWYLIADYPYFKAIQRGRSDAVEFSRENDLEETDEQSEECLAIVDVIAEKFNVAEQLFEYDLEVEQCERYITAIENALEKMPDKYAENIMRHIIQGKKYKDMERVSERTMKLWVQRFIWNVAHNLGDA